MGRVSANGGIALDDAQVAKALKITEDQNAKLDEAFAANAQAMRDAFQDFQGMSPEERQEKMTQLRAEGNKRLLAVLTDEQRAEFEKMQGAKIEIDRSQLFPGRRGS